MTDPGVTVVVPSRGRPSLHRLLTGLAAGETPRERFEVVVVLDGEDAVAPAPREDLALRILRQPRSGPARARNRGAAAANGSALAFIDDDCEPAPNWVARMEARLAEQPNALIGGRVVNALPHNDWAAASQLVLDLVIEHANWHGRSFVPSCNLGLRADHFAAIGGFDERFNLAGAEDRDFCDRWREAGRPVVRAEDVVVGHHHDLDFAGFWRQHRNYGRGAVDYQRARRERGYSLSFAPQAFYPSLAAAAVRHGRLGGVAVSQAAYLAGVASGLALGRRSG